MVKSKNRRNHIRRTCKLKKYGGEDPTPFKLKRTWRDPRSKVAANYNLAHDECLHQSFDNLYRYGNDKDPENYYGQAYQRILDDSNKNFTIEEYIEFAKDFFCNDDILLIGSRKAPNGMSRIKGDPSIISKKARDEISKRKKEIIEENYQRIPYQRK